jgi:hypothetical protein
VTENSAAASTGKGAIPEENKSANAKSKKAEKVRNAASAGTEPRRARSLGCVNDFKRGSFLLIRWSIEQWPFAAQKSLYQ